MSESLYEEARDIDSAEYEVGPVDEASIEDYPPDPYEGQWASEDEVAAERERRLALKPPVKIIDGVKDTKQR